MKFVPLKIILILWVLFCSFLWVGEIQAKFIHPGEKIITHIERIPDSTLKRITCVVVIDAPLEVVWKVMTQYENYGGNSKFLNVHEVHRKSDGKADVFMATKFPWPLNPMKFRIEFLEQPAIHQISWRQKEGILKTNEGTFLLKSQKNQTVLTFSIVLDIGKYFPQWAVNWGLKKNIPAEITRIRHSVRTKISRVYLFENKVHL